MGRVAVVFAASLVACLAMLGCSPAPRPETARPGTESTGAPSATTSSTAGDSAAGRSVRVVVLGDSNSSTYFSGFGQGPPWPELMASDLATRFPDVKLQLMNTAEFGHTSADVLANLERDCITRSPDVVVLMIGTNDPSNGIRLEETVKNVRTVLKEAKKVRGSQGERARVILVQPPVAQSKRVAETAGVFPLWCPYDESEDPGNSLKPMKEEYLRLADGLDIVLVPIWDRFAALGYDGTQPVRTEYLFDGLHLSAKGQELVAEWVGDQVAQGW